MKRIGVVVTSVISYVCMAVVYSVAFVATLPFYLFPNAWRYDNNVRWWIFYQYNKWFVKSLFLPIRYVGLERLQCGKRCMVVANHQSIIDMAIFIQLLGAKPCVGPFKKEVSRSLVQRVLLIGVAWYIDRSQPRVALRQLLEHADAIKDQDICVGFFPEGTRYYDGEIHEFQSGFALLAKKLAMPVLPVRFFNLNKVLRPDSWLIYRHPVTVIIGEPMHMQEGETIEAFKDRVHAWFVAQKLEDYV